MRDAGNITDNSQLRRKRTELQVPTRGPLVKGGWIGASRDWGILRFHRKIVLIWQCSMNPSVKIFDFATSL